MMSSRRGESTRLSWRFCRVRRIFHQKCLTGYFQNLVRVFDDFQNDLEEFPESLARLLRLFQEEALRVQTHVEVSLD